MIKEIVTHNLYKFISSYSKLESQVYNPRKRYTIEEYLCVCVLVTQSVMPDFLQPHKI